MYGGLAFGFMHAAHGRFGLLCLADEPATAAAAAVATIALG